MWPWKGAYTLGCRRPAWVWGKGCFHSAEGFRSSPAEVEGSLGVSCHPHQLPWALRHGRNLFAAHSQAHLKRNLFLKQSSNPMWHSLALMSWVHFLRWIYKAKSDCVSFQSWPCGCGLFTAKGRHQKFPHNREIPQQFWHIWASSQSTVDWTHCLTFAGLSSLILENDKAGKAFWDLLRSQWLTLSHLVIPKLWVAETGRWAEDGDD